MAQLQIQNLGLPAIVGVLSGVGAVAQANRLKQRATDPTITDNFLFDNAATVADLAAGGLALANQLMPSPVIRSGAAEGAGAGIAILARRFTNFVGGQMFTISPMPSRRQLTPTAPQANNRVPVRIPAAATQSFAAPPRPQFFSVT